MKIKAADFFAWYKYGGDDDWYIEWGDWNDDSIINEAGELAIDADMIIDLKKVDAVVINDKTGETMGVDKYVSKWIKKQKNTFVLLEVPKDKVDALREYIKGNGIKEL